jgi:prevent-host-death family protein
MSTSDERLDLSVDLNGGVVPISKAASALAALLKRARERRQPIVVTQKGYPTGVILSIEMYNQLCERAKLAGEE